MYVVAAVTAPAEFLKVLPCMSPYIIRENYEASLGQQSCHGASQPKNIPLHGNSAEDAQPAWILMYKRMPA